MSRTIKSLTERIAKSGVPYTCVSFGAEYGYVWEKALLAGIGEGDIVDAKIDSSSHHRITSITLIEKAKASAPEVAPENGKPETKASAPAATNAAAAPAANVKPTAPATEVKTSAPVTKPVAEQPKQEKKPVAAPLEIEVVDDPELPAIDEVKAEVKAEPKTEAKPEAKTEVAPEVEEVDDTEPPAEEYEEDVEASEPVKKDSNDDNALTAPKQPREPREPRNPPSAVYVGADNVEFCTANIPLLEAKDIQARVYSCTAEGVKCLLHRSAQRDIKLLNDMVGQFGWQQDYYGVNGETYCVVWLYDNVEKVWRGKTNVGTESDYEPEKSRATDAFKRACTCWGIGLELYSAPPIYIQAAATNVVAKGNGYECRDRFTVSEIAYDEFRCIKYLVIKSEKSGKAVFTWGRK